MKIKSLVSRHVVTTSTATVSQPASKANQGGICGANQRGRSRGLGDWSSPVGSRGEAKAVWLYSNQIFTFPEITPYYGRPAKQMRTSYFCHVSFFFFLYFSSRNLRGRRLGVPYFHTWCGLSANLECRSETCCARLAEMQDTKIAKNWPSEHHRTTLSGYIVATKAHIDNRNKTC